MAIIIGNTTVNTSIAGSNVTVNVPQGYAEYNATRNSIMPTLRLDFVNSNVLDPRITFTRASSATYFNSAGALTTAANNIPRFDYNPSTLVCNGLLIEQSSVNILLNSATLSTQSVTTTATTYTLSFYGTGTVTLSGTYAGSLVGSGAFPTRSRLSFTATAGTLTLTVTGNVSYAQLEALSFPTSYIATTGASATRSADVASIPLGTLFNSNAFTVYTENIMANITPVEYPRILVIDNGSSVVNGIQILTTPTSNPPVRLYGVIGSTGGFPGSGNSVLLYTAGAITKGALSVSSSSAYIAWNGATPVANNTAFGTYTPSSFTTLWISAPVAETGGSTYCGWARRIILWTQALSNNELISLTS